MTDKTTIEKTLTEGWDTLAIARTILMQLGGKRFIAMTGASSFSSGMFEAGPGLSFRLPTKSTKDRIMGVRIVLTPADLYTVEFLRLGKDAEGLTAVEVVSKSEGVYCDMLADVFEEATGLYTSL